MRTAGITRFELRPTDLPADVQARFWDKVHKTAGCWIWTGALNRKGYGQFTLRREDGSSQGFRAHRLAFELLVCPIPTGLVLDHQCHNLDPSCPGGTCEHRRCVNPDHLAITTHRGNVASAYALLGRRRR